MIKEFHVSKNLFDKASWDNVTATRGTVDVVANGIKLTATGNDAYTQTYGNAEYSYPVTAGETYTLSWDIDNPNVYGIVYLFSGSTTGDTVLTNVVASSKKATFTIPNGHQYLSFRLGVSSSGDTLTYTNLMLNTGSEALPYEPYGNTWNAKSYAKIVDTTQQVTSFPVVVRTMDDIIPSWTIKGNMVQTGTPTPSSPIQPSETGERTAQLFEDKIVNCSIDANGNLIGNSSFDMYIAKVEQGITYTASASITGGFYTTKPTIGSRSYNGQRMAFASPTVTAPITGYMTFRVNSGSAVPMFNTGSTALPYEPYGYKLDIKSGNTTTPVYLGQVQTTRKIRKLVLTGQENWTKNDAGNPSNYLYYQTGYLANKTCVCSHLADMGTLSASKVGVFNGNNVLYLNFGSAIMNAQPSGNTVEGLKEYLAAQYANGTPVCVWYVLATETTGTLNEPLRKIGTYSDSVSGTNLSVTAQSPTTIDVDTTLKPSEMDLTYTGLKMCKRKKKSRNLAYGRIDGVNTNENGTVVRDDRYDVAIGRVESGIVYTVNSFVVAFYTNEPTIGSVSYDGSRIVGIAGTPTTFTAPITGYVAFRLNSGEQAMLNTGSTALPYEPYWK